jgi:hypothetical protein
MRCSRRAPGSDSQETWPFPSLPLLSVDRTAGRFLHSDTSVGEKQFDSGGSRFANAIGNVIGHEGLEGEYESEGRSDFSTPLAWSLGHPGDPEVAKTLLRHGNFDRISGRTQWDPKIPERKLPDSLYLAAKPAFFGKLPWPPIGPDRKPMAGPIPARERFEMIPASERDAQDLLYLGEFHLAAGRADEARVAFREVFEKYPRSKSAPAARELLGGLK